MFRIKWNPSSILVFIKYYFMQRYKIRNYYQYTMLQTRSARYLPPDHHCTLGRRRCGGQQTCLYPRKWLWDCHYFPLLVLYIGDGASIVLPLMCLFLLPLLRCYLFINSPFNNFLIWKCKKELTYFTIPKIK